jgi:hypothetical protein
VVNFNDKIPYVSPFRFGVSCTFLLLYCFIIKAKANCCSLLRILITQDLKEKYNIFLYPANLILSQNDEQQPLDR